MDADPQLRRMSADRWHSGAARHPSRAGLSNPSAQRAALPTLARIAYRRSASPSGRHNRAMEAGSGEVRVVELAEQADDDILDMLTDLLADEQEHYNHPR